MNKLLLTLACTALLTACNSSYSGSRSDAPTLTRSTAAGAILTTPAGMTLYTFDKDMSGNSACSGSCAQNWPPFMAGADARESGDFTLHMRSQGRQWGYEGKPLYRFVGDRAPGDINGNGLKGLWHVVPADEAMGGMHERSGYGGGGRY